MRKKISSKLQKYRQLCWSSNFEITSWLGSKGVDQSTMIGGNTGGTIEVDGIKVTLVHAEHSCGITDGDQIVYGGNACGLVIEFENGFTVYFAGDTDVFGDMAVIAELSDFDVAFRPIGALVFGLLADRYPLKQVYLWAWAAQIPVLIVIIHAVELPLLSLMILLFSLETMTGPAENSLLVRYTPGRWRATAFGAKFVLAQGVSALGVPLVGYVFDTTGDFLWMFGILIGLGLIIVAAAIYLPREAVKYVSPVVVPAE